MRLISRIGIVLLLNVLAILMRFYTNIDKDSNIYILISFNIAFILFEVLKDIQNKSNREKDKKEVQENIDILATQMFQNNDFNHYFKLFEKKRKETGILDYALLIKALNLDPNNLKIKEYYALYKIVELLGLENEYINKAILNKIRLDIAKLLKSFLTSAPNNITFILCRGILEDQNRNYNLAQQLFLNARKIDPKCPWEIYYARSLTMEGNYNKAIIHLRSFVKQFKNNRLNYLYFADIHSRLGNYIASEKYYLLSVKYTGRKSLLVIFGLSFIYRLTGNFHKLFRNELYLLWLLNRKSFIFFRTLLKIILLSPIIVFLRCYFIVFSKVPVINKIRNPFFRGDIWEFSTANKLIVSGNLNGAIYFYKKALKRMPRRMDTYNNLAVAYAKHKLYWKSTLALLEGFEKVTESEVYVRNFLYFYHDSLCKEYNLPIAERKMKMVDKYNDGAEIE